MAIPTTEPKSVTAGDTIQWTRTLADYPANGGWTLSYRLINASGKIDITGSASGSDHQITVAPNISGAWVAGTYDWQAYVTNVSGERHTIGAGSMVVQPNLAAQAAGYDNRSTARQILDALQAAWLVASTKRSYVFEYRIANRMMRFATRQEWIIEIDYWRKQVAREEQQQRIRNGMGSGRKVLVRF